MLFIKSVPSGKPLMDAPFVIRPDFIDTVHVSGDIGERFVGYENQTAFRI